MKEVFEGSGIVYKVNGKEIILREIDEVYSVSTYMEKYVINAIMAGLDEIYSKEEKDRIDEK